MKAVSLRPAEPKHDFGQLAVWFSILEEEPNSESDLREYFERQRERIIERVAIDENGELLGFYWIVRSKCATGRTLLYLFVRPEQRGQGVGSRLYEDVTRVAGMARMRSVWVSVWDDWREGWSFAEHRGFVERSQRIILELNLDTFDDRPYDAIIARLSNGGFRFASMKELGDTEDAQRKLYVLNDTTARAVPGSDGTPSWDSFEDFRRRVCQADWYKPGGQLVAVDTTSGAWAAMYAVTRFEGDDCATTLHIGVDSLYRGRKLGQAVQVLALRYARDVLKACSIRNVCNAENLPALAINRKLGYAPVRRICLMEKTLE